MMTIRKFGLWEKTECDTCGVPFQVTRTQEKQIKGAVYCHDCKMYAMGYTNAIKEKITIEADCLDKAAKEIYDKFQEDGMIRIEYAQAADLLSGKANKLRQQADSL